MFQVDGFDNETLFLNDGTKPVEEIPFCDEEFHSCSDPIPKPLLGPCEKDIE